MADYSDFNPGDDDRVPLKLMGFVGGIALMGIVLLMVFLQVSRKQINANIDPNDQAAFDPDAVDQTDGSLQETPDLWVQKKPPRDDAPPVFGSPLVKHKAPTLESPIKKEPASQPSF